MPPTTRAGWRRYIRRHELPMLGQGAFREVFPLDDQRVLKLDRKERGLGNCQREANTWEYCSDELRPYLAAVLDSGPGWNIMERADETLAHHVQLPEESFTTTSTGLKHGLYDLHEGNIGKFTIDGQTVFKIIDYQL